VVITNDETFDTLFRQYEQPIYSYLARLSGDRGNAQELTQETFLRAYRALARGERWENPRAWLYRVASRLATDDHRRRTLLRWLPLRDGQPDPRQGLGEATAEKLAVQAALAALPPKYRVPLVLYVHEERPVADVAQTLGLSVSAVKMRLSRAREMFRDAYLSSSEAKEKRGEER
jgi:RNA polymerase sigma-70 factor (ECF subfamily)